MKKIQIRRMGRVVQGVVLKGDPSSPEPSHFRVVFPGGDVDIVRATDGQYWIHVNVNRPGGPFFVPGETIEGCVVDARVKPATMLNASILNNPALEHLAFLVAAGAKR